MNRLLNAAEAAIDAAAADDAERERQQARLYAPPKGERGRSRRPGRAGMSQSAAADLLAQLAAEDARLGG